MRAPKRGSVELDDAPRRAASRSGLRAGVPPLVVVLLVVVLFVVGLAPRLLGLGGAVTEDEDQWIDRTGTFAGALTSGEWRRTYLTGHPGVTVMWLTTLALGPTRAAELGEAARPRTPPGVPTLASGRVTVTTMPDFLAALHLARVPFAALNATLATLVAVLAWRLLGLGPGMLAGLLLALDPYWAGVGPIVGMDGPLTGFLSAALLSLLLACRALPPRHALGWTAPGMTTSARTALGWIAPGLIAPGWIAVGWTALAGALWGLALLTKTTALFILPLVPALLLAAQLTSVLTRRTPGGAEYLGPEPNAQVHERADRGTRARAGWDRLARDSVVPVVGLAVAWGVVGAVTVGLLWPAAWGEPFETAWRALDFSVRLGGVPHGPGSFFLGRPVDDPGPMFYPVALALRLGPATTLGLMALLLFGAPRRIRFAVWSMLAFVVLFLLLLTVASKKVDRYVLPVLPALDVLAGIGWWEAARRAARLGQLVRARRALLVGVAVGIAVLQAWPLVAGGRYPLAAYNPLFGGARAAELAIPVGWGDGLDVAADRIRDLSGRAPVTTAIWFPLWVNFQAHAPGPVLTERRLADADVYVDYVHARQRGHTPRQLVGRRPDAVVQIAGIDYARIYRLR